MPANHKDEATKSLERLKADVVPVEEAIVQADAAGQGYIILRINYHTSLSFLF